MIKGEDCIKYCLLFLRKEVALNDLRKLAMWGLPDRQPFTIGPYKLWPCFSKPEFQWFAAIDGRPTYFKTTSEAKLFIRDLLAMSDEEGLCD